MNNPSVPAWTVLLNVYQMGEVAIGGMSSHFDIMLKLRIMLRFMSVPHKTVVFIACKFVLSGQITC
jgi:hypothetical protein